MTHRVLVVEDSAPMCKAIGEILTGQCDLLGYVRDGADAVVQAGWLAPTAIVLDISLPNVSGLVLLPLLRAALPDAVIVMLTGHPHKLYAAEAFRRGADAYVFKGDAFLELPAAIRRGRSAMGSKHPA